MTVERNIELTCSKDINCLDLSYEEMIFYVTHNFYLIMNFLEIKYKKLADERLKIILLRKWSTL